MNQPSPTYSLNDQLTIDDLRAYQAGQLGGAALHRVERILLENPFYADALEGLDALQQVGANLHSHTRDLHVALQDRIEETATPRRLMPLWTTSAAASIILVICVALYHFFYVIPAGTNAPVAEAIEPGTVLIDSKALGISEPAQPVVATKPALPVSPAPVAEKIRHTVKAAPRPHTVAHQPAPVLTATIVSLKKPSSEVSYTPEDQDIMPLPISQADVQRRQLVDTERAFER